MARCSLYVLVEVVQARDEGCAELEGVLHVQRVLLQVLVKGSVGMVLKYGPELNVAVHCGNMRRQYKAKRVYNVKSG